MTVLIIYFLFNKIKFNYQKIASIRFRREEQRNKVEQMAATSGIETDTFKIEKQYEQQIENYEKFEEGYMKSMPSNINIYENYSNFKNIINSVDIENEVFIEYFVFSFIMCCYTLIIFDKVLYKTYLITRYGSIPLFKLLFNNAFITIKHIMIFLKHFFYKVLNKTFKFFLFE